VPVPVRVQVQVQVAVRRWICYLEVAKATLRNDYEADFRLVAGG